MHVTRRRRRTALTLVELTIVFALVVLTVVIVYQAIHILLRSEDRTDKGSMRAITEARMMETLLKDVRSAADVNEVTPDKEYKITRYVIEAGRAVTREITWRLEANGRKVTRLETGGATQTFDFTELMDFNSPPVQFRIKKAGDVQFDPGAPPSTPPGP